MNFREKNLLDKRLRAVKRELSEELQKPKAERRRVDELQTMISNLKNWMK